jgi:hypothetical protein
MMLLMMLMMMMMVMMVMMMGGGDRSVGKEAWKSVGGIVVGVQGGHDSCGRKQVIFGFFFPCT